MNVTLKTNWIIVWLAISAGIMAALQVGKVPPAIPALRAELGLSMVQAGWTASIFNVIGATCGVLAGALADRFNIRRVLMLATGLLLTGSLLGASAESAAWLIGSRVCAGFGLVGVAVAAPRLIIAHTQPDHRNLALGAWSIYMPAGFAAGMVLGSTLLPALGWRGVWIANALLLLTYLGVFMGLTRAQPVPAQLPPAPWLDNLRATMKRPGPWLLGGIFACYTVQWFALTTWMPTFLTETMGYAITGAALVGASVVAANAIGNLIGAWLLHHHIGRWWLITTAYCIMAVCAAVIFASSAIPALKIPLALLFSASGGLLPAAVLGGAVTHAPSPAHVATVNGFAVQGSHMGTLAGPPLFAFLVATLGGWDRTWILMPVMGTAGLILTYWLRKIEMQITQSNKAKTKF